MSGQRKLLFFAIKVFILILVFAFLWPFVAPGYTTGLATVTDALATINYTFRRLR